MKGWDRSVVTAMNSKCVFSPRGFYLCITLKNSRKAQRFKRSKATFRTRVSLITTTWLLKIKTAYKSFTFQVCEVCVEVPDLPFSNCQQGTTPVHVLYRRVVPDNKQSTLLYSTILCGGLTCWQLLLSVETTHLRWSVTLQGFFF